MYGIHIGRIITTIRYSLSRNNPFSAYKKATGTSPVASSVHVILCYVHMDNIANNTAQLP
ncbi:hypothetical protein [Paenibacillus sp. RU26A]|uniref:hypothetical protein n=1 Tax=Paenibacillus sp. RU26A TaxID=1907393 RepID=UPI00211CF30D|nr:hypothetical protein [Paenibacillus sp. RU26A]